MDEVFEKHYLAVACNEVEACSEDENSKGLDLEGSDKSRIGFELALFSGLRSFLVVEHESSGAHNLQEHCCSGRNEKGCLVKMEVAFLKADCLAGNIDNLLLIYTVSTKLDVHRI